MGKTVTPGGYNSGGHKKTPNSSGTPKNTTSGNTGRRSSRSYSSGGGGYSSGGGSVNGKSTNKTTTKSTTTSKVKADKNNLAAAAASAKGSMQQYKNDAAEQLKELNDGLKTQDNVDKAAIANLNQDTNDEWVKKQIAMQQTMAVQRKNTSGYGSQTNQLARLADITQDSQDVDLLSTYRKNYNNQMSESYAAKNKLIQDYNAALQKNYDSMMSTMQTYMNDYNDNIGYKTETSGKDVSKTTTNTKKNGKSVTSTVKNTSNSTSTTTHNKNKFLNYKNNQYNWDSIAKSLGISRNYFDKMKKNSLSALNQLGNYRSAQNNARADHAYEDREHKTNIW